MVKKLKRSKENDKLLAFVATFLSIVGFIIALIAWHDNKYIMFYARQSLVIFIVGVVAGFFQSIFSFIPVIGNIIVAALWLIVFLLWLFSWIYALSGKEKDVPVVGDWARKIDL